MQKKNGTGLSLCRSFLDYCCSIAPVGHAPAHVPHSTQAVASMSYFPSPAEIAPTGHSPSQVPHDTHASVITYAILFSSFYNEIQNSKLCSFENILIQKTSEYKYKIKYQICIKRPILEKIKTGLHILPFGLIITTLTVGTLCFITKGGYIYGSTGYRKDYDRRTASDR